MADRLTSKGKDMPIALVDRVHASMGRSELREFDLIMLPYHGLVREG